MNNEFDHFSQDNVTDISSFGLDSHNPMHGATEKDRTALGNPPEHLDLEAWEGRSGDRLTARQADAPKPDATQQWMKQFGSSDYDSSNGIATDSNGNVYLTGYTRGDLTGTNPGGGDAWVAKYDSSGNQQWTKQFGSSAGDYSNGIATDSSGNVYLTGSTSGDLAGQNAGDTWVAKYDSSGNQQWTKQFDTSDWRGALGIATDSNGNAYLTGSTQGDLAGQNAGYSDAWVAKYDSSGNQQWIKQFGTSNDDYSDGIATDSSGNVYLIGDTERILAGRKTDDYDVWVAKYDSNGNQQWTKQFGSSAGDISSGIVTDKDGNIYLTGSTSGDLAGQKAGWTDVWVAKYDSSGDRQWTKQFGSSDWDFSHGIATDKNDNVYLTGYTEGDLAGQNAGGYDAWGAKINPETQSKISISATDSVAAETANPGEFTITRTGDTIDPLTVNYSVNGKAINGEDYQKLTGSVIIPAGETNVSLPIDAIDDNRSEYPEKVTVDLKSNIFYNLDAAKSATVTIADNDKPVVSISAHDSKAAERKVGETANPGKLKVSRAGDLSNPLTVSYKVTGTATKGTDYKLPSKITFPAGVHTVGVSMKIVDDALVEGQETANVILTSSPNYNLAKAKIAKVAIADNDK